LFNVSMKWWDVESACMVSTPLAAVASVLPSDAAQHPVAAEQAVGGDEPRDKLVPEIVVKAPVFGVVEPIVPGIAQVPPSNSLAFRTPVLA